MLVRSLGGKDPLEKEMANHSSILANVSHVQPFVTLWTVACQAPLSVESLQARILEWVAMLSSRGSSRPRD